MLRSPGARGSVCRGNVDEVRRSP